MVHVYSTLIGGLLAGAATAVCSNKKGRKRCMKDKSCGWQKLATANGKERSCVAVEPEANPGTCETETAKLNGKVGKQKKQINRLKAKIAELKNGSETPGCVDIGTTFDGTTCEDWTGEFACTTEAMKNHDFTNGKYTQYDYTEAEMMQLWKECPKTCGECSGNDFPQKVWNN